MKQFKSTFATKTPAQQKNIANVFRVMLEKFMFDNKVGMADLHEAGLLPAPINNVIAASNLMAISAHVEKSDQSRKEVVINQRQPTINEIYTNVVNELNMTSVKGQNEIMVNLISKIKKDRAQSFDATAKALEAAQSNHKEASKSVESFSFILDGTMDLLNIR